MAFAPAQAFARRERVEVAGDDVKAVLVFANAVEQQPDFSGATALAPFREPRAQMEAEDARVWGVEHDLEERMSRAARAVPRVVRRPGNRLRNPVEYPRARSPVGKPRLSATRATTSGSVASCSTTTSGSHVRMTDASCASRPVPPYRML